MNHLSFSLDNFEGSLELLLYLIQREEVDVCDVAIHELTGQLIDALENSGVETNAELMGLAATLLLMKSQKLLPKESFESDETFEDPRVEMIEKLIEYCRFRDTAGTLATREEAQQVHFPRAAPLFRKELGDGLEEIGLEDLKEILNDVVARAERSAPPIEDEEWHVSSKLDWFRAALSEQERLPFEEVFSEERCRGELVVSFLALLELMKWQELRIVKENDLLYIIAGYEHKPS